MTVNPAFALYGYKGRTIVIQGEGAVIWPGEVFPFLQQH